MPKSLEAAVALLEPGYLQSGFGLVIAVVIVVLNTSNIMVIGFRAWDLELRFDSEPRENQRMNWFVPA